MLLPWISWRIPLRLRDGPLVRLAVLLQPRLFVELQRQCGFSLPHRLPCGLLPLLLRDGLPVRLAVLLRPLPFGVLRRQCGVSLPSRLPCGLLLLRLPAVLPVQLSERLPLLRV